mmetsp:Transcript_7782/g.20588  ORF Transcript_7782/g.20588 Transcript_7782/m.20588 type:complete len:205 (+) Transcript_7782:67-681(+)
MRAFCLAEARTAARKVGLLQQRPLVARVTCMESAPASAPATPPAAPAAAALKTSLEPPRARTSAQRVMAAAVTKTPHSYAPSAPPRTADHATATPPAPAEYAAIPPCTPEMQKPSGTARRACSTAYAVHDGCRYRSPVSSSSPMSLSILVQTHFGHLVYPNRSPLEQTHLRSRSPSHFCIEMGCCAESVHRSRSSKTSTAQSTR